MSWSFAWRRNLFQWEEDLVKDLVFLLESVVLSPAEDSWCWLPDPNRVFSVKSSYNLLMEELGVDHVVSEEEVEVVAHLWESAAPSKVIAFSWQLLLDRIPSRGNLQIRGILGTDVPWECVGCVGKIETSLYLFLHCPCAMKVWCEIFKWIGVELVIPPSLSSLFVIFKGLARNDKIRKGFLLIWHATIWSIWKARNSATFVGGSFLPSEIVEAVKVVSWKWCLSRLKLPPCLFYEWTWNPGDCLLR
jgi:hypothetical protein